MKAELVALALLMGPVACGSSTPEPVSMAPAEPVPGPAPVFDVPNTVDLQTPPAEPTPEEKKKIADAKQLADDRAQWEAEAKAELARWTPELHAEAKTIAERKYPTLRAAFEVVLKSKHREPGNAERDKYRHPLETLEFFAMKPGMSVLEYGPGEGWYTELLAPVLAAKGKLSVTTTDPNGPAEERSTFYGQRIKVFLDKSPELFGKVARITIDSKKPDLALQGTLDMVVVMRGMHGWARDNLVTTWLAEIHEALKPGGVLGIEQHRAKPDADAAESAKKGYLPEPWVITQIEGAGFKLTGKSEINANPKDTKDYEEGVWTLPPTYRLKDKDRQKYTDIGESDRMTLRFVKVVAKNAKK